MPYFLRESHSLPVVLCKDMFMCQALDPSCSFPSPPTPIKTAFPISDPSKSMWAAPVLMALCWVFGT